MQENAIFAVRVDNARGLIHVVGLQCDNVPNCQLMSAADVEQLAISGDYCVCGTHTQQLRRAAGLSGVMEQAINQSVLRDETVRVDVYCVDDAVSSLHEVWDGDIDYVDVGDYVDVWGWTEDTPQNQQDWRLHLAETG